MADERPSDAMQPSTKRRAGGQVTKDDFEDEDEPGYEPGSWKPVDTETLKRRKIVKVRRGGEAPASTPEPEVAPATAPASANPFAGISLTAPASSNPFAGVNLVAPSAAASSAPQAAAKPDTETTPDVSKAGEKDGEAKGEAKPAEAPTPAEASSNPFAALGSSSKPFSGFGGGFGGFGSMGGGFGAVTGAGFGSSTGAGTASGTPTFNFGTGAFPNIAGLSKAGDGANGEEGDDGEVENLEVFGASTAEFKPVVQLPDQKTVTGEEEEQVAFTADGALFEFDPPHAIWRERGKGEYKVNVDKSGNARMVMRQAGNYRLLLNAKIYAGMAVQKMPGNVGVSFACFNAAQAADTPHEKKDGSESASKEGSSSSSVALKQATWCVKIKKNAEQVGRLFDLLEQRKVAAAAAEGTEGAPPAAAEDKV
mmetsp:Transcript_9013/g.19376  ORF Transcript_9013/g.19376 Transcript_9013/m.19376 type:complete len:424 (+) Transcript_9013:78-1349(+)